MSEISLPRLKMYYPPTLITTVWYCTEGTKWHCPRQSKLKNKYQRYHAWFSVCQWQMA